MAIVNRPLIEIEAPTAAEALRMMREAAAQLKGVVNDPRFKIRITGKKDAAAPRRTKR